MTPHRLDLRIEADSNYNVIASITPLGNRTRTVFDERDLVFQRVAGADSDVMGTFETDYDAQCIVRRWF